MNLSSKKELDTLITAGVISEETADRIQRYYTTKKAPPRSLTTIFGVIGALLTGLGIILILAHNWDTFSKMTKTIWAFIPLLVGQGVAAYTFIKKKGVSWREASALFLFLAIGASISLVSQIYHIPGSMGSFLFTWIALAAPLVYLLRSYTALLMHLIFSTAYACNLGYFNSEIPWWYLAQLAWAIPFYLQELKVRKDTNSTGILNWLLPLSVIITLGAFVKEESALPLLAYIMLFGLWYNLGNIKLFASEKLRRNGCVILGSVGMVITCMIASFKWMWKELGTLHFAGQDVIVVALLGIIAVLLLGYTYKENPKREFNLFQFAFLVFTAFFFWIEQDVLIPTIGTNLLILALGIFAIRIGVRKNHFGVLNYGLLIITVLIACRFFDTNIDFVIRGILFVLVGIGFFVTNYLMYKKQQKTMTNTPTDL